MEIAEILRHTVIPWTGPDEFRLLVAQLPLGKAALPPGVRLSRRKLRGRRVASKGPRHYVGRSIVTAHWPDDHLVEKSVASLVCVVSGEAMLPLGETILHCNTGHFVFIPAGVPQPRGHNRPHLDEAAQQRDAHCDLLWFYRWNQFVRCWMCHSRGHVHQHDYKQNFFVTSPRAAQLFDLLSDEALEGGGDAEPTRGALLRAFLCVLEKEIARGNYTDFNPSTSDDNAPPQLDNDPMKEAQRYVKAHLNERLSIAQVARHVHMSPRLFTDQFRDATGHSFVEFVTANRLQVAQELLRTTDLTIGAVSRCVGIRSPAQLYSLFVRRCGVSPTEFRRSARRSHRESAASPANHA